MSYDGGYGDSDCLLCQKDFKEARLRITAKDNGVDVVAAKKRLAQADLKIDENGLFVQPPEKPAPPKRREHIKTVRAYIQHLSTRGIAIDWREEKHTTKSYIVTDSMAYEYDKDGWYVGPCPLAQLPGRRV